MEILTDQLQYQRLQSYQSFDSLILLSLKKLLSYLGLTIVFCLECCVGLHVGAVAGWVSGWCTALTYKHYCQPTRFISIDVMRKWHYLPYEYGRGGLLTGAIIGTVIVVMLIIIKSTKTIETKGETK